VSERSPGTLAQLTRDALRAAEAERCPDVRSVTEFLYRFNSVALTERWERDYPNAEATAKTLGIGRGTEWRSLLQEYWLASDPRLTPGWMMWTARSQGDELGGPGPGLKLYVSPALDALRPTLEAIVQVLPFGGANAFKVGAGAADLLRPDKIVVYFSDLDDLSAAASRLTDRLQGVAAQGVPFTSEISGGGLLSWSVDPPLAAGPTSAPPVSWRSWITLRAAQALVAAQSRTNARGAPWRRALDQLQREGIDIERWVPRAAQWTSPDAWR